jgi:hypothetical protein
MCPDFGSYSLGRTDADATTTTTAGQLLPNSANRYNVAEPQLFFLTFFQS